MKQYDEDRASSDEEAFKDAKDVALLVGVIIILVVISVIAGGCAHNTSMFTEGEWTRIGLGDYGMIARGRGVQLTTVNRENTVVAMKTNAETGLYKDANGAIKGIEEVRIIVGPQVTGYLQELAETAPDVAMEYVKTMRLWYELRLAELESGVCVGQQKTSGEQP